MFHLHLTSFITKTRHKKNHQAICSALGRLSCLTGSYLCKKNHLANSLRRIHFFGHFTNFQCIWSHSCGDTFLHLPFYPRPILPYRRLLLHGKTIPIHVPCLNASYLHKDHHLSTTLFQSPIFLQLHF